MTSQPTSPQTNLQPPKIQAYLAQLGLGSRRQIERLIVDKKITVNGKVCELGVRVTPKDKIVVDGKPVWAHTADIETEVLMYHKKAGEICTRAKGELPTVFDHLPPVTGRWVSVGRLDVNTSGLLLFTNNGQLANQLMHPRYALKRTYLVRVYGQLSNAAIAKFKSGIMHDGELLKFDEMIPYESSQNPTSHKNHWFKVVLSEGKNREIRRVFESEGCQVSRLIRIQYGPVTLPKTLPVGAYQHLSAGEIEVLSKLNPT